MLYAICYIVPRSEFRVLFRYPQDNYPATFMTREGVEKVLLSLDPRQYPQAHAVEAKWESGCVNYYCECSVCWHQITEAAV